MKYLVTGANGFLGKYVINELVGKRNCPPQEIDTLGLSDNNSYSVDLTAKSPELQADYDTVVHLVGTCTDSARADLLNVKATGNLLSALERREVLPKAIVYVSSTEVYGRETGENFTEADIADPISAVGVSKLAAEQILEEWAARLGVKLTIFRCPAIVGTGMNGWTRRLVNKIYRGFYHHIADETARYSVVHAVDVAYAIAQFAGTQGVFNLTDGTSSTLHDIAEAFAYRLDDKRIFTLTPKRAKTVAIVCDYLPFAPFGTPELQYHYNTLTFSCAKASEQLGWQPNSVVNYLRTHNYDEDSL